MPDVCLYVWKLVNSDFLENFGIIKTKIFSLFILQKKITENSNLTPDLPLHIFFVSAHKIKQITVGAQNWNCLIYMLVSIARTISSDNFANGDMGHFAKLECKNAINYKFKLA